VAGRKIVNMEKLLDLERSRGRLRKPKGRAII